MVWCVSCGESLEKSVQYCWRCGTKAHSTDLNMRSQTDALENPTAAITLKNPAVNSSESDSTDILSDAKVQLSPGAFQSFLNLKRKYNQGPMTVSKRKKTTTTPESVDIGVQILDKDQKIIRKTFESQLGVQSILYITVKTKSSEEDWIKELKKMFKEDITFTTRIVSQEGFRKPTNKLTLCDLEKFKKQRKSANLRLFVVAEGKGKKEIKKAYKGTTEDHVLVENLSMDIDPEEKDDSSPESHPIVSLNAKVASPSPGISTASLQTSLNSTSVIAAGTMSANPEPGGDSQVPNLDSHSPGRSEDLTDQDFSQYGQVEKKTENSNNKSEEKDVSAVQLNVELSTELTVEDHDWEKFIRLQRRLEERKLDATNRVLHVKQTMKCVKQFTIFYLARNNTGMSFKAPIDADIGYLYDMVCLLLDADVTAPKFKFTSGSDIFERSYKGNLKDVPAVLQLVEEEFTPDDTLTNYDDVLF